MRSSAERPPKGGAWFGLRTHSSAARGSGSFVYVLGVFSGTADLDPTAGVSLHHAAGGYRDTCLARLLY